MFAHILLWPLFLCQYIGEFLGNHVFAPWREGTTAKDILEQQIGVYGVLAYLIYKCSRLLIEAFPLVKKDWLIGRAMRRAVLAAALVLVGWLCVCVYCGVLIPLLDLRLSYGGLIAAPIFAWVILSYVLLAERVRAARALEDAAGDRKPERF